MSASNGLENSILALIFQNANIANLGDVTGVRGSTTAGNLSVSLHTADPGEAGNQGTSEIAYTGYARVAVVRSASGWTVTGSPATNAANAATVTFPTSTGGSGTATHFGIGTDASGAGNLLFSGALNSSLVVTSGMAPTFAAGALSITSD